MTGEDMVMLYFGWVSDGRKLDCMIMTSGGLSFVLDGRSYLGCYASSNMRL